MLLQDTFASLFGNVQKRSVAQVPIDESLLLIGTVGCLRVDLRIDMAIHHEDVFPAVMIDIKKTGSPTQKPRVDAETAWISDIIESAVTCIAVERGSVVSKVGFYDVKEPVIVIVCC